MKDPLDTYVWLCGCGRGSRDTFLKARQAKKSLKRHHDDVCQDARRPGAVRNLQEAGVRGEWVKRRLLWRVANRPNATD